MTATVLATMKNEGAFLLDWLAHYKALGFDRFLICTNDCDDPTVRLVVRLQRMGLARHHATRHWPATSMQRSAYKQALNYAEVQEADWVFACDADEFLVVKTGDGSLNALIAAATPEADAIAVPWRIFGPDGRRTYEDRPVPQQFTRAEASPRDPRRAPAFAKSLLRGVKKLRRIGVHLPVHRPGTGPFRVELPGGKPFEQLASPMHVAADYSVAQVNHYALRSRDSFLVKRERGKVNHMNSVMDVAYWDRFDLPGVPCTAIRRYEAATAEWRARLMEDRGLRKLHAEAVAWHRARIEALQADPDWAEIIAATEARLSRCETLAS